VLTQRFLIQGLVLLVWKQPASAAAIGGYIANTYSFTPLFIAVSIVSFLGAGLLVYIFKEECTCRIHLPISAELKFKYGHRTSHHAVKHFK
jgi:hypothetical protein